MGVWSAIAEACARTSGSHVRRRIASSAFTGNSGGAHSSDQESGRETPILIGVRSPSQVSSDQKFRVAPEAHAVDL
jgi:hypothetical protein